MSAAASKSIVLGLVILAAASLFVPLRIVHPAWMIACLAVISWIFKTGYRLTTDRPATARGGGAIRRPGVRRPRG